MSNSIELQKLTSSVETMRASVLQAYVSLIYLSNREKNLFSRYLDLHERFTKTTELQTSALTALWKRVSEKWMAINYSNESFQCETQSLTHQHETEQILYENRLLSQRIHELETRLNINQSKPVRDNCIHRIQPISHLIGDTNIGFHSENQSQFTSTSSSTHLQTRYEKFLSSLDSESIE